KQAEERLAASEEHLRYRAQAMASLYDLTTALAKTRTVDEVASLVVGKAFELLGASAIVAYAGERGDSAVTLIAQRGLAPAEADALRSLPLGSPLPLARAIQAREPLW